MGRGDARKSALNYANRSGGKVTYKGKTKNPEKQTKAPTQQGKQFTIPTTSFEVCRMTTKKEKPDTKYQNDPDIRRNSARAIVTRSLAS